MFPFRRFVRTEAAGGILLLTCAAIALTWANSPWAATYFDLWRTVVTLGPDGYAIAKPLLLWINDGLMAIFFFVVGLEIKREVLAGELSSPRQAALPVAAALGGAILPALIYTALNTGGEGGRGWGVPMATDIAFALGVLALLGARAPTSLKIFLTALAIIDDLLAVLVIALFYTAEISWGALGAGVVFLAALVAANRLGLRRPAVYALLGLGLWLAFLQSGVHATIAGVLLAMTIPARTRMDADEFVARSREIIEDFARSSAVGGSILTNKGHQSALEELEAASEQVQAPMQRLEHVLHPWVSYAIVPIFALANAGVSLGGAVTFTSVSSVTLGVVLGLVLGKQLGVTLFAWLAVRSGVASLPEDLSWRHIYGAGWLAGIGFTMSLFIAGLAFGEGSLLDQAKVGILAASLVSGVVGWTILRRIGAPRLTRGAILSASDGGAR